jgi:hypothetical protein
MTGERSVVIRTSAIVTSGTRELSTELVACAFVLVVLKSDCIGAEGIGNLVAPLSGCITCYSVPDWVYGVIDDRQ